MKKLTPSKQLGLTQRETAMILGVSEGLYAMYESGLRTLPVAAMQKLAEMLAHMDRTTPSAKRTASKPGVSDALRAELEHMLRENEYQRLTTERKINALEKKMDAHKKRQQLASFFADNNARTSAQSVRVPNGRQAGLSKPFDVELMKLQIKLEVLEAEKAVIERKIVI